MPLKQYEALNIREFYYISEFYIQGYILNVHDMRTKPEKSNN